MINGTLTGRYDYDLSNDVRAVEAMANGLVPYVYEDELYGLMPSNLPRLTVGSLLMRLQRLQVLGDQLTETQRTVLAAALKKVDEVRQEWHVAFTGKIKREFKARVEALEQYLGECADNLRACADNFPSNMEKRVMIEHLYREAEQLGEMSDDLKSRLPALDGAIRRFAEPSDFRWDARLEPVYPRDDFWYLYSAVSSQKK